mmetsp:Transcript_103136/g.315540  ORF Transcript_103136/g.315540 Transcript_103136/m.315540 type:complete len:307 (+) Transcript_103136:509-1429(+)
MRDLRYGDGFLLGLAHLALEHRPEVRAPHAQELVGIDRLPLHDERDVGKLLLVEETPQVRDQRTARDVDVDLRRELELPEVVQTLLPIVAAEDKQGVIVHVARVAEARARHVRLLARTGDRADLLPLVGLEAERIQVIPRAAGAAAEEVHGVPADHRGVRVARRGRRHLAAGLHEAPLQAVEVELVEIVEVLGAIVAADDKHAILVRDGGGPVAGLGDGAFDRHDGPLPLGKIVPVEVAPVVPVVAREHVHRTVVLHAAVAVPGRGGVPQGGVHHGPDLVFGVVLPEVVDAVVSVVAGEDVNPIAV